MLHSCSQVCVLEDFVRLSVKHCPRDTLHEHRTKMPHYADASMSVMVLCGLNKRMSDLGSASTGS